MSNEVKAALAKGIQQTLIDKAIGYFDPVRGARRMQARSAMAVAGAYTSTNPSSQTRTFRPAARSAAADLLSDLPSLRGQSRELARNNPIAVGALNTNCHRIVGTGLALSAQPNAAILGWSDEELKAWKKKTQAEFSLWSDSKDCDITGHQDFYELQDLVLRGTLESGDTITMLPDADVATRMQPYRLRVQVLEADRVGNPQGQMDSDECAGGVKLDPKTGRAAAYHVYRRHPGAGYTKGGAARYEGDWVEPIGRTGRRRLLHHFRRLRPEQPRGVPYLAPVINSIKQLGRYSEAEITAAIVSSYFTVFVTTEEGNSQPIWDGTGQAPADLGSQGGGSSNEVSMDVGAIVDLAPKEKVEFANPSRPNTGYEPFISAVIREIGVALSLPYELLIKSFNASYSASKAALLDAWMYFRTCRTWLARSFCQPVYETWLAEAVAIGRISAPGFFTDPLLRWAYTRAAWNGDSQGSINPKDEVAAYRSAIDGRLMTAERAEWELFGSDWNETLATKSAENKALIAAEIPAIPTAGAAPAAPAPTNSEQTTGAKKW